VSLGPGINAIPVIPAKAGIHLTFQPASTWTAALVRLWRMKVPYALAEYWYTPDFFW